MAAHPPYSPPPGSTERDQARLFRAQERAIKDATRAQQRFYRDQTRGLKRRSILGPLLVLSLGILLLLGRLGHLTLLTALTWYGRWWPLLLVAAGVVLVLEWAWDERTARTAAPGQIPYIRRGVGGGIITLLVVLGLAGAALRGLNRDSLHGVSSLFSYGHGLVETLGDEHEQDQTLDIDLPAGTELIVDNPHGNLTLTGSSTDGRVHVDAHKRVHSLSDPDADRRLASLSPTSQATPGSLHLSVPSLEGGSADLTISVPAALASTLNANRGEVRVSGLSAPVSITAESGDVELNALSGPVAVRLVGRKSSVAAHDLKGSLTLQGTGQDIVLDSIGGGVVIDGDFYGDTHVGNLSGPLHFHTSRTSVRLLSVQGTLDISPHADFSGNRLTGPIAIETYSRNIDLTQVTGDVQITNRNGTVEVQAAAPLGTISIVNADGAVTLGLPNQSSALLHAESRDGNIVDQFAPQPVTRGESAFLDGKLQSGTSKVDLKTTNADITIAKNVSL